MGVGGELDAARLQLWEDRAAETRRQRLNLVAYLGIAAALAAGLGFYYLSHPLLPKSLAVVTFALVVADLFALVLAANGRMLAAGVLAQVLPILPVLYAASVLSVEAAFGSYLFVGALGVMVTIPEGHNAIRYVCVALLLVAVVIIQVFFTRANASYPLNYEQTAKLATFNQTVMTIALFTLALELTRATRAGHRLVEQSLHIAELVATTDPLTGLPNRRPVWERLETAAREGQIVTVGLADVDYFKTLNDAHGHDCGDDALRHVATVLSESVRSTDIVARWGGEEFLILVDLPLDKAMAVFERARSEVARRPAACKGEPHHVTLSIGVAALLDADPDAAITAADAALYRAKQAGRDRVVV